MGLIGMTGAFKSAFKWLLFAIRECADFRHIVEMSTYMLGYARVSTDPQSLDQQIDALRAAGVEENRIYSDKLGGTKADRPGLQALLAAAREGDTIVVVALDRLGRSLSNVIRTIETLNARGIVLQSLRENLDFGTPTGRMMAAVFAAMAEYERELIKERAAAARQAAAARGRHTGRPRVLRDDQVELARRMYDAEESVSTIARVLKVSRATIYRAVADRRIGPQVSPSA